MRLCYLLLSPTFGMHQYTADLANRMARAGQDVQLITTAHYPADRYLPSIRVQAPVATRDSGFSRQAFQFSLISRVLAALREARPDVVHITGPHIWNTFIISSLRRQGVPVVHSLHDLDPHPGTSYGPLLHLWNRSVLRSADHILMHGARYGERLRRGGLSAQRLTCTPLLHLFLGSRYLDQVESLSREVSYEPTILFFGRIEPYKGIADLLAAWTQVHTTQNGARLVLAGHGELSRCWAGPLPPGVELRNRLITDEEAADLFRHCGLLVLPYTGATQSALVPAAYFFRKPVIVSRSGALPEYVQEGGTGWIVEPGDPQSLALSLLAALADRDRLVQMGEAGRAWYDRQRRDEESALWQLYERLCAGYPAHSTTPSPGGIHFPSPS